MALCGAEKFVGIGPSVIRKTKLHRERAGSERSEVLSRPAHGPAAPLTRGATTCAASF